MAELALGLAGFRFDLALPRGEPRVHEPDPVLGWRARPGRYQLPAYSEGGRPATLTIWEGGLRATAPERRPREEQILVLGCSYTQGWAVSDRDTYAWKLQERFPDYEVLNAGTSAWGTYQSLLRLEEHLAQARTPPAAVLLGFFGEHATRNVADPRWLRLLSRLSERGHVALPYCRLASGGGLDCFPPTAYAWPALDRHSSLVFLARQALDEIRRRGPVAQKLAVTEQLLLRLQETAHAGGSALLVATLHLFEEEHARYLPFLAQHGIRVVECTFPDMTDARYVVQGEGHPNGRMHSRWAHCIEPALRQLLEERRREASVS